jgi:hypothetical protein
MGKPEPLKGDAFHDPSATGPRASHHIPNGGVFSVYQSVKINAPPKAVYDTLLDIRNYKEWNTFVPEITITSHPHSHHKDLKMEQGTNMIFHYKLTGCTDPTKENIDRKEVCSHIDRLKTPENHPGTPRITRIRWDMHNAGYLSPAFLLKSQCSHELEELEDGMTMYRMWKTWGGLQAGKIKKKYEQALKEGFEHWCRDLKNYVEGKQGSVEGVKAPAVLANGEQTTAAVAQV